MDDKTRKNYRARIVRICKWFEEHQSQYYEMGVREVTADELVDPDLFFFKRYKLDLVYQGLNVDYILRFLLGNEQKERNENDAPIKYKTHTDMRKYKDAIQWGAQVRQERLPRKFYEEMDKFLGAYKKKLVIKKKTGEVDEHASDPIPEALYERIIFARHLVQ